MKYMPAKHPNNVEPYFFIWCDEAGTNVSGDNGELQGATINTIASLTVTSGLTIASSNKNAVTIKGISYAANTVVTVWVSGGTDDTDYTLSCKITTSESDARTLEQAFIIPVRVDP
jgi:hypothetical protein